MQFPLEVTGGPLATLLSKNRGRPGRPVWSWGDLQSGRLSTVCCGQQAAATRYGTSSQSESPSGRDGTLAHPEQLARPCQGPPELRSCSSRRGASLVLCLLTGHLESREEKGFLRHGQQCAVTARKAESVTGSVFLAHSAVRHGSVMVSLDGSRVCLCSLFVPYPKPL